MSGMSAGVFVALVTGFGVYQSCTKFAHMRRRALIIDAVGVSVYIIVLYFLGAWK